VRRHKLHKGMRVFLNTLKSTEEYVGTNGEMKEMIGTYIRVKGFCNRFNESIYVVHPGSLETYTIHCKDVSIEPILKGRTETFKVGKEIKARFDVNTLTV